MALEAGLTLTGRLSEYRSFWGSFKWVTARESDLLQNMAGWLAGLAYLGAKEQWGGCDRLLQDQDTSQKGSLQRAQSLRRWGSFASPPHPEAARTGSLGGGPRAAPPPGRTL